MALYRLTTRWRPDATVEVSDPTETSFQEKKKKKSKNGLEGRDGVSGGGGLGPG